MRGWDFIREGAGAAEPRVPGLGAAGEAGPAVPTGHSSSGGGGSAAAAAEPPSSSNSTYSEPTSAFASTGAEVMERGVDVSNDAATATPLDQIAEVYEIDRCVEYILKHGHSKVALQFPDSLLGDSIAVAEALIAGCKQHVFVLADTVYGSCCVDEVAAEHAAADMIIHFGISCLSQASRTPVLFVFGTSTMLLLDTGNDAATAEGSGGGGVGFDGGGGGVCENVLQSFSGWSYPFFSPSAAGPTRSSVLQRLVLPVLQSFSGWSYPFFSPSSAAPTHSSVLQRLLLPASAVEEGVVAHLCFA
eukprot:gene6355-327_t